MNNKKHAFMVPVMTLAVCAIAMVGLGFSLSSSVTSDSNAVEDLMIDMSGQYSYFDTNGEAASHPGTGGVNKLLGITLTNKKTGTTPGIEVTGGAAYMKIYGNVAENITLKVKATADTGTTAPTSLTITLYTLESDGTLKSAGTVEYSGTSSNTFGNEFTFTTTTSDGPTTTKNTEIKCEKVYVVAITEINGWTFSYTNSGGTLSGTVVNSSAAFVKDVSLQYAFTVTYDPSTSGEGNNTETGQTGGTQST